MEYHCFLEMKPCYPYSNLCLQCDYESLLGSKTPGPFWDNVSLRHMLRNLENEVLDYSGELKEVLVPFLCTHLGDGLNDGDYTIGKYDEKLNMNLSLRFK